MHRAGGFALKHDPPPLNGSGGGLDTAELSCALLLWAERSSSGLLLNSALDALRFATSGFLALVAWASVETWLAPKIAREALAN
jgi:hypothetical protein